MILRRLGKRINNFSKLLNENIYCICMHVYGFFLIQKQSTKALEFIRHLEFIKALNSFAYSFKTLNTILC